VLFPLPAHARALGTWQCCKLLSDVTFPTFYPRLFSVVSRVLDTFGRIVYERIATKAFDSPNPGLMPVLLSRPSAVPPIAFFVLGAPCEQCN